MQIIRQHPLTGVADKLARRVLERITIISFPQADHLPAGFDCSSQQLKAPAP